MEQKSLKVDLQGNVALVTGSSKGIGKAIAVALAENGAAVIINYLTSEKEAKKLKKELEIGGSKVVDIKADVSSEEDVQRMIKIAREKLGGDIDILVNNAGTQVSLSTIEDMSIDIWDRVMGINLTGVMLCSKYVIPGMKQKGWGRIINISSISARSGGGPKGVAYASAKGGLSTFTKGLAKELGPFGITVNAIAPGVILTEMHEKFSTKESLESLKKQIPLARLGQSEDVVGAVLFLVSDSASYVTGETIAINGGLRMD
jgi:3-oxoacyl-[acyl-carrier protein] reductase